MKQIPEDVNLHKVAAWAMVSRAMTMTATRLTAPKITTLRYPDVSNGPHTAMT